MFFLTGLSTQNPPLRALNTGTNMAKSKKSENSIDVELIKSDIASFASSIGLSSSLPTSGFDDSDFRKGGPLEPDTKPTPNKPFKKPNPNDVKKPEKRDRFKNNNQKNINNKDEPPKPRVPVLSLDNHNISNRFDKFKNLPKLPLVKASSLGVWYMDAAELEEKVTGKKKVEYKNVDEWKNLVAKKKDLGERLLAQYTQDYESSRGQSGDIKMLIATQRSGTATDKVSAFSVMVGENPIANMKSLDALIGTSIELHYAVTFSCGFTLYLSSL